MFIGPYEHHCNELPWRESIADVVVIPEDADGHIDLAARGGAGRGTPTGRCGSAASRRASNVTGHRHRHRRDRAAAARARRAVVLGLRRRRALRRHRDEPAPTSTRWRTRTRCSCRRTSSSAGPARRACSSSAASWSPTACRRGPGGGTVAYVNPTEHRYLDDPVHREEGGTPAIVESIRAGLVFQLKEAVGADVIRAHEEDFLARAMAAWAGRPGDRDPRQPRRRAAVDRVVRRPAPGGRYLHHNFVVALLNDLFGIQSRGGCSCAGPYGHRLLGIDLERSHEFEREIALRLRGHQARLGAGQLQLLHQRGGLRLHRRGGGAGRGPRLAAAARLPLRPGDGVVAAPRRSRSSRRCAWPMSGTTPTACCAIRRTSETAPEAALTARAFPRSLLSLSQPLSKASRSLLGADSPPLVYVDRRPVATHPERPVLTVSRSTAL